MSPGCDLPYAVKPSNLEAVSAVLHDPYQLDVARKLPVVENNDPFDDVVIPDYAGEESVIIDVVTLDSAGCAPCAYMLSAAQEAAKAEQVREIRGKPHLRVREHPRIRKNQLVFCQPKYTVVVL